MPLRHILRLDALERCMLHSLRLHLLKKPSVFDAFAVAASIYGYARIGRCLYSRRDTSHCPLPPVCVRGACKTVSRSVCCIDSNDLAFLRVELHMPHLFLPF